MILKNSIRKIADTFVLVSLLHRVTQKINSILDLDLLLDEITIDLAQTLGYSRTAILLVDDEANELVIATVRGWTQIGKIKNKRYKIGQEGMCGHVAATGETDYAPDIRENPYYVVCTESTRSEVDIPLKIHDRIIGVLNAQHDEVDAFHPDQIKILEALARHIATAIENARLLQREKLEKERLLEELDAAGAIQFGLLPGQSPDISSFEVSGLCMPCGAVGGDWYDFIPLKDGRVALVLADVSGKGMGAALLMASTRSILRLIATSGLSPTEVLQNVNRVLIEDFPRYRYVTMIYAILDPSDRSVVFANAGHPWPLSINSSGAHFWQTDAGLPLGFLDESYSEQKIDMRKENCIYFYSDGVTEAMNPSSDEYGTSRLQGHVAQSRASIKGILDDVNNFMDGNPANDDITIVMIKACE